MKKAGLSRFFLSSETYAAGDFFFKPRFRGAELFQTVDPFYVLQYAVDQVFSDYVVYLSSCQIVEGYTLVGR